MRVRKKGRNYFATVYVDGKRIERTTKCRDKRAAEAVASGWERAAADPNHARKAAATLSDGIKLHLAAFTELAAQGKRSADTIAFYRQKHGQLIRFFETEPVTEKYTPYPLSQLSADAVDRYISHRRSEKVVDHTIHKELTALRAMLKRSKRAGLWSGDIDELIPPGFSTEYKPKQRALSFDEIKTLLGQLLPYQASRVAFICATGANWRESELAKRDDVTKTGVFLQGTKTEYRRRTVPVVLDEQRTLLKHALAHVDKNSEMMFERWQNARRDLHDACARAKLEPCSPNDLRRSFAHLLRNAGAPVELLAPSMGHADGRMVERVYAKHTPAELRAALERSIVLKTLVPLARNFADSITP